MMWQATGSASCRRVTGKYCGPPQPALHLDADPISPTPDPVPAEHLDQAPAFDPADPAPVPEARSSTPVAAVIDLPTPTTHLAEGDRNGVWITYPLHGGNAFHVWHFPFDGEDIRGVTGFILRGFIELLWGDST